jgi:hypothetical protein
MTNECKYDATVAGIKYGQLLLSWAYPSATSRLNMAQLLAIIFSDQQK